MPKRNVTKVSATKISKSPIRKTPLTTITLITLILLASFLIVLNFLYKKPNAPTSTLPQNAASLTSSKSTTYMGTLPCADCPGIQTEITLSRDKTYRTIEIYLERNDEKPLVSDGTWSIIENPNAGADTITYKLVQLDVRTSPQYYLLNKNGELKSLDANMKEITSPGLNFTLTKKN